MVSTGAPGAISVLLDIIPVIIAAILIVSFIRRRSRCRAEEQALNEVIDAFSSADAGGHSI